MEGSCRHQCGSYVFTFQAGSSHTQHAVKHTHTHTGVKNVDTNVEAKSVVVEADESVAPQIMLEKLEKVCLRLQALQ